MMTMETRRTMLATVIAGLMVGTAVAGTWDVRDFGARGDGVTKDTAALQRAIDAASSAGGGRVSLGPGTYLSGSIFLKSGVDLHLEKGARLLASPDRADYNAADVCPQNWASTYDNMSGGHLILAIEQENVSISGAGVIDGNMKAFNLAADGWTWPGGKRGVPWRPGQMLFITECRNVRLSGVRLWNAPYWTCFLYGCEDVTAEDLDVYTSRWPRTWNGDGIDVDACRKVRIRRCAISTDDDSVTFRASGSRLRKKDNACEDIVVEDCTLSSVCNAMRFGVGSGAVRNVTVRRCRVADSRIAVCFVAGYTPKDAGAAIEDVRIEDLDVEAGLFCFIYHRFTQGHTFRRVAFRNVKAVTRHPSRFYADERWPFEDFSFENVTDPSGFAAMNVRGLEVKGGTFPQERFSPERTAELNELFKKNKYPFD